MFPTGGGPGDQRTRAEALRLYSKVGLNGAARQIDGICSRTAIRTWAKEAGIKSPTLEQRRNRHLNRRNIYLKARRIRLNDQLFARVERMLKQKGNRLTPAELKSLALTYAILVDKRRLEEGEDAASAQGLSAEEIYEEGQRALLRWEQHAEPASRNSLVADIAEERRTRRVQNGGLRG